MMPEHFETQVERALEHAVVSVAQKMEQACEGGMEQLVDELTHVRVQVAYLQQKLILLERHRSP